MPCTVFLALTVLFAIGFVQWFLTVFISLRKAESKRSTRTLKVQYRISWGGIPADPISRIVYKGTQLIVFVLYLGAVELTF